MTTTSRGAGNVARFSRNTSLTNRLHLFLRTAFPTFLEAMIPTLDSGVTPLATYKIRYRAGTRFPAALVPWNSREVRRRTCVPNRKPAGRSLISRESLPSNAFVPWPDADSRHHGPPSSPCEPGSHALSCAADCAADTFSSSHYPPNTPHTQGGNIIHTTPGVSMD